MEIQPNTTATPQPAAQGTNGRTSLTSDYEMFLKMLTTQMTNQDPLNPVDSSDYAVQLATFSSVEQQVLTNELLTDLTTRLGGGGLSDLGSWIGREVRSAAPVQFDGTPITVTSSADSAANRAELLVLDANNRVVQTQEINPRAQTIEWTGRPENGPALANGQYSLRVKSYVGDDVIADRPAQTYARINEARLDGVDANLILESGAKVAVSDVTAIRG